MNNMILSLWFSCFSLYAAENLQFTGTLIESSPCIINNDEVIEIDFAKVAIDKIDGNNFIQPILCNISCRVGPRDSVPTMKITMSGAVSDFNPAGIATDVDGLGIEIRQNGQPLRIGEGLEVSVLALPLLQAVPVKKSGAALQEGPFEAWATLLMEIQ